MLLFVVRVLRPYWKHLAVVVLAMLIETVMTMAAPWPLKLVLDSVLGTQPLPEWLSMVPGSCLGA